MTDGKANVRLIEWDTDKTRLLGSRYQFWLKLSERPDGNWQQCFQEVCDQMDAQQTFRADVMMPYVESDPAYVRVLCDPRDFEKLLYPRLKEAVRRANELFNKKKAEEQRRDSEKAAKRADDERVIAELKTRFRMD